MTKLAQARSPRGINLPFNHLDGSFPHHYTLQLIWKDDLQQPIVKSTKYALFVMLIHAGKESYSWACLSNRKCHLYRFLRACIWQPALIFQWETIDTNSESCASKTNDKITAITAVTFSWIMAGRVEWHIMISAEGTWNISWNLMFAFIQISPN